MSIVAPVPNTHAAIMCCSTTVSAMPMDRLQASTLNPSQVPKAREPVRSKGRRTRLCKKRPVFSHSGNFQRGGSEKGTTATTNTSILRTGAAPRTQRKTRRVTFDEQMPATTLTSVYVNVPTPPKATLRRPQRTTIRKPQHAATYANVPTPAPRRGSPPLLQVQSLDTEIEIVLFEIARLKRMKQASKAAKSQRSTPVASDRHVYDAFDANLLG